MMLCDDNLCLSCFEQLSNAVGENSEKFTGTFDHWKLLSRCGFLQTHSKYRNEKRTEHPIINVCHTDDEKRITKQLHQQQQSFTIRHFVAGFISSLHDDLQAKWYAYGASQCWPWHACHQCSAKSQARTRYCYFKRTTLLSDVSVPTKPIFVSELLISDLLDGTRANNFWQYDKHSFRKVNKFVEIWN